MTQDTKIGLRIVTVGVLALFFSWLRYAIAATVIGSGVSMMWRERRKNRPS